MKPKEKDLTKRVGIVGATILTTLLTAFIFLMFYMTIYQVNYLIRSDIDQEQDIRFWAAYGPYLWITVSFCVPNIIGVWVLALSDEKEIKYECWDNLLIPSCAVFVPAFFVIILKFTIPAANDLTIEDITGKDFIYLLSLAFSGFWVSIFRILRKALAGRVGIC